MAKDVTASESARCGSPAQESQLLIWITTVNCTTQLCITAAKLCVPAAALFYLGADAVAEDIAAPHPQKDMNELWGDQGVKGDLQNRRSAQLFRDGNYAMFIHWGLYSQLAGQWENQTYYGIGEWLMHPRMAGIPVEQYKQTAATFNPVDFDAKAVVRLAQDAGMKYIVITSKHHEGFAMFDSEHPFNITDATPFGRDPMKELSAACQEAGIGFGFYYSHNQDWTSPGAHGGPANNSDGTLATFDKYFQDKCLPQVKEICTNYGPLAIVWFDTPGDMPKHHVVALRDLVRELQPGALLCSRIGYGMGDYTSHGDMEVPPENIDGMWETVDTTNDSWSYAWYDTNWKSADEILRRLISTVARGGTYMLNVGPDGRGRIPETCQRFLREAGDWIRRNPDVIYAAGPSPWRHEVPWGDVTVAGNNTLHLCIYDLPADGKLYLPGLKTEIESAELHAPHGKRPIEWSRRGSWTCLQLPPMELNPLMPVVQVRLQDVPDVDPTLGIHPNIKTKLIAHCAQVSHARKERVNWMEKFGEWKHMTQVSDWEEEGSADWNVDVAAAGLYHVALTYRGEGRLVWRIESDEGERIQNQQAATSQYESYPMGILEIKEAGRHTLKVSLVEGDPASSSLCSMHLQPIGKRTLPSSQLR